MNERLYRSRKNKLLGGVASGLAKYANIDPIIVRIIFIIITFLNGLGFLLYIVLWIVIPEENITGQPEPKQESFSESAKVDNPEASATTNKIRERGNGRVFVGIVLIGLGFIFLVERFFPYFDFEDILPMVLVAVGLLLVVNTFKNKK